MKRFYWIVTIVTFLFTVNIIPADAQNQDDIGLIEESTYNGNGVTLDDIFSKGSTTSERILFYNTGKKMFLNAGGFWGTRTATHTVGLPLIVEKVKKSDGTYEDYYLIQSPFNGYGIYMAKVTEQNQDNIDETSVKNVKDGVFLDRESSVSYRIAPRWRLTRVKYSDIKNPEEKGITEKDVVYKIQCLASDNYAVNSNLKNDIELVGNCKMTISVFAEGNYNLVRGLSKTHASYDEKYSYWKIVNMQEFTNTTLDDVNYYNEKPIDLTFLIRGQNFNRLNKYNLVSQKDGFKDRGWSSNYQNINGDNNNDTWYKTDFASANVYKRPSGISDSEYNDYHADGKFGMFYCGRIAGVKIADNTKPNYKVYQTVPVTQPGWYRIDCQGFYKTNGTDCIARIFAISDENANLGTAKNAYVNLLPQSYMKGYDENIQQSLDDKNNDTNYILANLKAKKAPENYVEAGVSFYTGCYPNSVLVYVSNENTSLKMGIEVTKREMTSDEVIYFDDFRLKYLGQSFALDDQDKFNSNGNFKNRPLVLRRALKEDKWNSIVLPVNLTKYQVNTTFFPYPRIAEFTGFKDRYTIEFKTINLDDFKEDDVVLKAGSCYIIRPGYNGNIGDVEIKIGDEAAQTMKGPYYMIDRVSYNSDDEPKIVTNEGNPYTYAGSDCKLTIKGSYKPVSIPQNSYLLYNSKLMHLTKDYYSKGYCWWIEDEHQMGANGISHSLFMSDIESNFDETTGFVSIKIGEEETNANDNIYNLQGQKMHSRTALSRGIYICKGKKIIVK